MLTCTLANGTHGYDLLNIALFRKNDTILNAKMWIVLFVRQPISFWVIRLCAEQQKKVKFQNVTATMTLNSHWRMWRPQRKTSSFIAICSHLTVSRRFFIDSCVGHGQSLVLQWKSARAHRFVCVFTADRFDLLFRPNFYFQIDN